MRHDWIIRATAVSGLIALAWLLGGGCHAVPTADGGEEPLGLIPTQMSKDTATGNERFNVVHGEGNPSALLCSASYAGCQPLASNLPDAISRVEAVPSPPDVPAPRVADVIALQKSTAFRINMETRTRVEPTVEFKADVDAISLDPNGISAVVIAGDEFAKIELPKFQSIRHAVALGVGRVNSLCPAPAFPINLQQFEQDYKYYFGGATGAGYIQIPEAGPPITGVLPEYAGRRSSVACGAGRVYIASENSIRVHDSFTGAKITSYDAPMVQDCMVTQDGKDLYCTKEEGEGTRVVGWNQGNIIASRLLNGRFVSMNQTVISSAGRERRAFLSRQRGAGRSG